MPCLTQEEVPTSLLDRQKTYLGEALDGGLAGAVGRVVVQREEGGRAGGADDLASLSAGNHPLGTLLGHDERRSDVHLEGGKQEQRQGSRHKCRVNFPSTAAGNSSFNLRGDRFHRTIRLAGDSKLRTCSRP